jgi:hypothetical protein
LKCVVLQRANEFLVMQKKGKQIHRIPL